jgi:hypothetical protein
MRARKEHAMRTLVLQLDDELIRHAEVYSAKTGKSLAELVGDYLAAFRDEPRRGASLESEPATAAERRAQRQYGLAAEYPGEFVVLVGEEVVHHSADRQSAFAAYDQAFVDFPSGHPVIVDPARRLRRRPVVRGRSLKRSA